MVERGAGGGALAIGAGGGGARREVREAAARGNGAAARGTVGWRHAHAATPARNPPPKSFLTLLGNLRSIFFCGIMVSDAARTNVAACARAPPSGNRTPFYLNPGPLHPHRQLYLVYILTSVMC